jgi:hypothetical protein
VGVNYYQKAKKVKKFEDVVAFHGPI